MADDERPRKRSAITGAQDKPVPGSKWNEHTQPRGPNEPSAGVSPEEHQQPIGLPAFVHRTLFDFLQADEDRISLGRVMRSYNALLLGSFVYGALVADEFPEFAHVDMKRSIVGGGREEQSDGSWSRYYRLLVRGEQMRSAIQEYLTAVPSEERLKAAEQYNSLPIEKRRRHDRPPEVGDVAADAEREEAMLPIDVRAKRIITEDPKDRFDGPKMDNIDSLKEAFLGTTPLSWARFYYATKTPTISLLISSFSIQLEVLSEQSQLRRAFSLNFEGAIERAVQFNETQVLSFLFQLDGPLQSKYIEVHNARQMPTSTDSYAPLEFWRLYVFWKCIVENRYDVLSFIMSHLGIYTHFYSEEMQRLAVLYGMKQFVQELVNVDLGLVAENAEQNLGRITFWKERALVIVRGRHRLFSYFQMVGFLRTLRKRLTGESTLREEVENEGGENNAIRNATDN